MNKFFVMLMALVSGISYAEKQQNDKISYGNDFTVEKINSNIIQTPIQIIFNKTPNIDSLSFKTNCVTYEIPFTYENGYIRTIMFKKKEIKECSDMDYNNTMIMYNILKNAPLYQGNKNSVMLKDEYNDVLLIRK